MDNNTLVTKKPSLFSMETKSGRILSSLIYPVAMLVLYVVCHFICVKVNPTAGGLIEWNAFSALLIQAVPYMYIAWGLAFLFSAGPDFSAAAIMGLSCMFSAVAAQGWGLGYFGLFGMGLILFVVCQLISTFVRMKFQLTAWVCGFAMMIFYEGIGSFYTTYRASMNRPVETLAADVCRDLPKQPWPIVLIIVGIIAHYIILNKTTLGLNYRAVGSNPQVAGYMGIKAKKTLYLATIIGALFVGMASVYNISYAAKIASTTGMGSMAFLGKGLSTWLVSSAVSKKLNQTFAIALSAFFLAVFFNFLTRIGVPAGTWQEFIMGIFIVVFGSIAFAGTKGVQK